MSDDKHYPKYKGDGVAVWVNTDKNGEPFLSVSILGGKAINCFKYEPKPKNLPLNAKI